MIHEESKSPPVAQWLKVCNRKLVLRYQSLAIVTNNIVLFSTTPLKLYSRHQPILEGNNFNII